jgi:hypothetical protein
MCSNKQICLEIYHPAFRDGYEFGRCLYFQKGMQLTDKHIVEGILHIVKNPGNQQSEYDVYYAMGFVCGMMSACVLPPQIGEEDGKAAEEAFLQKVRAQHGAEGEQLAVLIRQRWDKDDRLAQVLDAPTFVQMLNRGKRWDLFVEDVEKEIQACKEKE